MAPVRSTRRLGHCMLLLGAACLVFACGGRASYWIPDDSNDHSDDALDHTGSGGDVTGDGDGEPTGTGGALSPAQNMGTGGNGSLDDLSDLPGTYVLVGAKEYDFINSATFSFYDGDLMWSVGCNRHYGPYTVRDGVLWLDWFEKSQTDCGEELNNRDSFVESFLLDRPQIYREGEHIIMTSPKYTFVLLSEADHGQ